VVKSYELITLNPHLKSLVNPAQLTAAVIAASEMEKDPRILIIDLDLFRCCMRSTPEDQLNLFIEEIFGRFSLYFPISFTPPKDDKYLITPEMLKDRLNRCFVATSLLANLSFPFVLDKLSATQPDTKQESLALLKLMLTEYSDAVCQPYIDPVATNLLNEYFHQFDEGVQKAARAVIATAVDKSLGYAQMSGVYQSYQNSLFATVIEKCIHEIEESPDSMTQGLATELLCVRLLI